MIDTSLPNNADLEAAKCSQFPAPTFDEVGVGGEVRHLSGDGSQRCAEKTRQAQQRRVDAERRDHFSLDEQAIDVETTAQQPVQWPRAHHYHAPAAAADERDVADELQRIPL